jgi:predicted ester cyclase
MERTPEEVVRLHIEELWGNRRLDLVDELVGTEYRADGNHAGRDFVRRNIVRMHTAFPDLRLEIRHLLVQGDRVAALFCLSGTHGGGFAGVEATGRPVRFQEAGFFTVRNGMVVAADYVADGLSARIQMGVLPDDFWVNSNLPYPRRP